MTWNCFLSFCFSSSLSLSATQNVFPLTRLKLNSTKNERENKGKVKLEGRVLVETTDKKPLKCDYQIGFCLLNQWAELNPARTFSTVLALDCSLKFYKCDLLFQERIYFQNSLSLSLSLWDIMQDIQAKPLDLLILSSNLGSQVLEKVPEGNT